MWSRNNGAADVVQASERPAGLGFPPPAMALTLSTEATNDHSTESSLAMAPDGRVIVLWRYAFGAGAPEVRYIEREPNGTWMPASLAASKPSESAHNPDVAIAANGSAIGSWIANPGGGELIQAGVRPPGGAFAGYRNFGATSVGPPDVASNRAGDTAITWGGSMGEGVFSVRRPAGGDFGGIDTLALGTQGAADPAISLFLQGVALDDQGNTTALWRLNSFSSSTVTNIYKLQASSYDAAPPTLDAVSVPATGTPGGAVGMAATASDRLSSPSITWSFGDGATGAGPAVSHAYGAAGRLFGHGDRDRHRGQLRQRVALGRDHRPRRQWSAGDAADRVPGAGPLGRRQDPDLPAAPEGHEGAQGRQGAAAVQGAEVPVQALLVREAAQGRDHAVQGDQAAQGDREEEAFVPRRAAAPAAHHRARPHRQGRQVPAPEGPDTRAAARRCACRRERRSPSSADAVSSSPHCS